MFSTDSEDIHTCIMTIVLQIKDLLYIKYGVRNLSVSRYMSYLTIE